MGLNFKDVPQGGGGWLKPAEHLLDAAILVEVLSFDHQRPTPNGPKDSVLCDFTYFGTEESLEVGVPTEIAKGVRVEQTVLARDLKDLVGAATIVTLAQVESKKPGSRPAWVWRQCAVSRKDKVIAYATNREAEVQAALDAAPDFD